MKTPGPRITDVIQEEKEGMDMPNDPGRKIKKDQLAITVEKRDISRGIADSSSKTKKIHQATQMEDHKD